MAVVTTKRMARAWEPDLGRTEEVDRTKCVNISVFLKFIRRGLGSSVEGSDQTNRELVSV